SGRSARWPSIAPPSCAPGRAGNRARTLCAARPGMLPGYLALVSRVYRAHVGHDLPQIVVRHSLEDLGHGLRVDLALDQLVERLVVAAEFPLAVHYGLGHAATAPDAVAAGAPVLEPERPPLLDRLGLSR